MAEYSQRLRFDEAIAFFRQKISLPTEAWDQIIAEAQDFAFSLAGVESALVLQTVYDKLLEVIEGSSPGIDTFQSFADTFQQTMQAGGYGEQQPWRVALVYGQNVRNAYNAGRYRQQTDPELMAANPYLQWIHDHPLEPRPHHKALHLKVFRADDPIWRIVYPADGFGCRCRVMSLSDRDLKREGLTVEQFPSERVTIRDRLTGKTQRVPAIEVDGVLYPIAEPGFTTAPGSSPHEHRQQILEGALNRLSPRLRSLAEQQIDFEETLDFARLKNAGNTQQVKNCVKGWPCGFTCLSRAKKNCKKQLEGQSADLQQWLENSAKSEPAGDRWAGVWSKAPKDLLDVIAMLPAPIELTATTTGSSSGTAHYDHIESGIFMAQYTPEGYGAAVYRHEYGHHVDYTLRRWAVDRVSAQLKAAYTEDAQLTDSAQKKESKKKIKALLAEQAEVKGGIGAHISAAPKYAKAINADSDRMTSDNAKTLKQMDSEFKALAEKHKNYRGGNQSARDEHAAIDNGLFYGMPKDVREGRRALDSLEPEVKAYHLREFHKNRERGTIRRQWEKVEGNQKIDDYAAEYGDRYFEGKMGIYADTWRELRAKKTDLTTGNITSLITADKFNDRAVLVEFVEQKVAAQDDMGLMVADFAGAITLNKIGYGHSNEYYEQRPNINKTEAFANFVAMYGTGNPYYSKLMESFAPQTYKAFRELIRDVAGKA